MYGGKIFFASPIFVCIFALAFESESCKQEKHCDATCIPTEVYILAILLL